MIYTVRELPVEDPDADEDMGVSPHLETYYLEPKYDGLQDQVIRLLQATHASTEEEDTEWGFKIQTVVEAHNRARDVEVFSLQDLLSPEGVFKSFHSERNYELRQNVFDALTPQLFEVFWDKWNSRRDNTDCLKTLRKLVNARDRKEAERIAAIPDRFNREIEFSDELRSTLEARTL